MRKRVKRWSEGDTRAEVMARRVRVVDWRAFFPTAAVKELLAHDNAGHCPSRDLLEIIRACAKLYERRVWRFFKYSWTSSCLYRNLVGSLVKPMMSIGAHADVACLPATVFSAETSSFMLKEHCASRSLVRRCCKTENETWGTSRSQKRWLLAL